MYLTLIKFASLKIKHAHHLSTTFDVMCKQFLSVFDIVILKYIKIILGGGGGGGGGGGCVCDY